MNSIEKVALVKKALENKKGLDIKVLMVSKLTVITEYFIIASGSSSTQIRALSDEVDFEMSKVGIEPKRIEGYNSDGWILMDYNDIVVHLFHKDKRNFYDLERVWADAQVVEI